MLLFHQKLAGILIFSLAMYRIGCNYIRPYKFISRRIYLVISMGLIEAIPYKNISFTCIEYCVLRENEGYCSQAI